MTEYYLDFYIPLERHYYNEIYFNFFIPNSYCTGIFCHQPLNQNKIKEKLKYFFAGKIPDNTEITLTNNKSTRNIPIPESDFTTLCKIIEKEFDKVKFTRS